MAIWEWTEEFIDVRVCSVEADTEEEALKKIQEGDWLCEDTIDFYSRGMVSDLVRLQDETIF